MVGEFLSSLSMILKPISREAPKIWLDELPQLNQWFHKYDQSKMTNENVEIKDGMMHKIKAGRLRWRSDYGILYVWNSIW